jgi:hypothetical protein
MLFTSRSKLVGGQKCTYRGISTATEEDYSFYITLNYGNLSPLSNPPLKAEVPSISGKKPEQTFQVILYLFPRMYR